VETATEANLGPPSPCSPAHSSRRGTRRCNPCRHNTRRDYHMFDTFGTQVDRAVQLPIAESRARARETGRARPCGCSCRPLVSGAFSLCPQAVHLCLSPDCVQCKEEPAHYHNTVLCMFCDRERRHVEPSSRREAHSLDPCTQTPSKCNERPPVRGSSKQEFFFTRPA
jgi:hypothetical protein